MAAPTWRPVSGGLNAQHDRLHGAQQPMAIPSRLALSKAAVAYYAGISQYLKISPALVAMLEICADMAQRTALSHIPELCW
jgi:hypothetical protein